MFLEGTLTYLFIHLCHPPASNLLFCLWLRTLAYGGGAKHTVKPPVNPLGGLIPLCHPPGSNLLFGLPVVMDTFDPSVKVGQRIALHYHGEVLAVLEVESKWTPDKVKETYACYK